jgi:hypothetical protein
MNWKMPGCWISRRLKGEALVRRGGDMKKMAPQKRGHLTRY